MMPTATLHDLRIQIESACQRAGRDRREVTLIGAAKTVEAQRLRPFLEAGLRDIGENYVQEGAAKRRELGQNDATWHLIGSLQRNKAREAVVFDWIHTLDRLPLAQALDRAAGESGKRQRVLIAVNLGGEASKAGCAPDEAFSLAQACAALPHLDVRGLMCLPPWSENPEDRRPYFQQLRGLCDELQGRGLETCRELSMGMSHDFDVAIEEGATMIRVGTRLFGERAPKNL